MLIASRYLYAVNGGIGKMKKFMFIINKNLLRLLNDVDDDGRVGMPFISFFYYYYFLI